jgi:hypothetical protein
MTIDIGPNLMWVARMAVGIVLGWAMAQPLIAVIDARARVEVAKIEGHVLR